MRCSSRTVRNKVLIDRIEVIDIVLHPEAHRHKFRQEGIQKAGLQHDLEHGKGLSRMGQDVKELLHHLRVSPGVHR